MLRILALCALLIAPAARADESAITGVIREQIDAFLVDDFATAFTFASPAIRQLFGTPENFGAMVRRGYPMVWRPARVEFLEARPEGSAVYQRVFVLDGAGVPHVLEYMMVEGEGGWRINGVRILAAPPVGA